MSWEGIGSESELLHLQKLLLQALGIYTWCTQLMISCVIIGKMGHVQDASRLYKGGYPNDDTDKLGSNITKKLIKIVYMSYTWNISVRLEHQMLLISTSNLA